MNNDNVSRFMSDLASSLSSGDMETAVLLLTYGEPDWSYLPDTQEGWFTFALSCGCSREVMELMLSSGAPLDDPTFLVEASKMGGAQIVDWALSNGMVLNEENWFSLCEAIRNGDEKTLGVFVSHGCLSVNRPSWFRDTLLTEACKYDSDLVFELLLNAGVDVNEATSDGITPLEICLAHRKIGFAEKLLDAGAKVSPSEKQMEQWGLSEDDIRSSIDDESERSWMESSRKGFPWVLLILEQSFPEKYRLAKMLMRSKNQAMGSSPGGKTVLHEVVKDKAWIDALSGEEICEVIRSDRIALVRAAIARGASPDAFDRFGWSPLLLAISMDDREVFGLLLSKSQGLGSPVGSPLGLAASLNRMVLAEQMLKAGFSPDAKDEEGKSPVERACEKGFIALGNMLMEASMSKKRTGKA